MNTKWLLIVMGSLLLFLVVYVGALKPMWEKQERIENEREGRKITNQYLERIQGK
jgi:hypothetical protein